MANYRQIHVSIWKDDWFLDLEIDEKLLFIYLFSNELASLAGIYKIPLRVIAFETGLDLLKVQAYLDKFERAEKVYYRDGIIWVKNLRRYNQGSSKVQTRIQKDIDEIPYCQLKGMYLAYHPENIPYGYHIDTISYEMKRNEMKGNEEGQTPPSSSFISSYPSGAIEANQHPDIMMYRKVSGMFPGESDYARIIDAFVLLRKAHPDDSDLESYLLQYWLRWENSKTKDGKPFSKFNPAWLTEWAVNNYTPPKNGSEPHAQPQTINYTELRLQAEAEGRTP